MTIAVEEARLRSSLRHIETIESVSATLPTDDERRRQLETTAHEMIAELEPVRVEIAARLLHISDKTVRAWVQEGALIAAVEEPRLLLDPERLHQVMHLVQDLRAAGQTRGLLYLVWRRLSDQASYLPLDFAQFGPSKDDVVDDLARRASGLSRR
jgi:hypothetical protein